MNLHYKIRRNVISTVLLIILNVVVLCICSSTALADTKEIKKDPAWTIHFRPGIKWGTDDRTLYVLDFLILLYQGEKNILFANTKFTPNDLFADKIILNLITSHQHPHLPYERGELPRPSTVPYDAFYL